MLTHWIDEDTGPRDSKTHFASRNRRAPVSLAPLLMPLVLWLGCTADNTAAVRLEESAHASSVETPSGSGTFEEQRRRMINRQRRVILNNDGDDAVRVRATDPANAAADLLADRTLGLEKTHVDTVFYSTTRSFSQQSHRSQIAQSLDKQQHANSVWAALWAQDTDPLQVMVEWGHEHDVEIFWSARMNDRHDTARPDLLSDWKQRHPKLLMGTEDNPPAHGGWSQVNYDARAVRSQIYRIVEEVCQNYDIDGIELDFFRHPCFFRDVAEGGHASQAQTKKMTELVRKVRSMTERVGRARGRPIMVAIRVPDSVPLARAMGLDVEAWLSKGLADLLIGSGYFRMAPWTRLVELGRRHGVKVYAGLSESRINDDETQPHERNAERSYRGRAHRAWQAGVDGIYLFNVFNPHLAMLSQLGDPELLSRTDKTYFATFRGTQAPGYSNPDYWVADGSQWLDTPIVSPDDPVQLDLDTSHTATMQLGDDLAAMRASGYEPEVSYHVLAQGGDAADLQVRINGQILNQRQVAYPWIRLPIPPGTLRPGDNAVQLTAVASRGRGIRGQDGFVVWTAGDLPAAPWRRGAGRLGVVFAELRHDAMLLADRGTGRGDYLYFTYDWNAAHDSPAEAEADVQVLSGQSTIIVSNGIRTERLVLHEDRIETYYSKLVYEMDTTDRFHSYRVRVKNSDIKIYVDGALRIDGPGAFTQDANGRNSLKFGASSSAGRGEALWRSLSLTHQATEEDPTEGQDWPVMWRGSDLPATPWRRGAGREGVVFAELRDDAMLLADRGTEHGDYLYVTYDWNAAHDSPAEAEADVQVLSGRSNIIVSNGVRTERLVLREDRIETYYSKLVHEMDTTDRFHSYRVHVENSDIKVYVDGALRIDGTGAFTQDANGRNSLKFGASSSPGQGEALWRSVGLSSPGTEEGVRRQKWPVMWTANAQPATPWRRGAGGREDVVFAELRDNAMLVADRGTEPGDYLYFTYNWRATHDSPAEAEADVQVLSGRSNIIVSNGVRTERLVLHEDRIETYYSKLVHEMDTTDRFHSYRVHVENSDIKVYVDGALRIDGTGAFTQDANGRNSVKFGASSSSQQGEALWRTVGLSSRGTDGAQIHDLVLTIDLPARHD